MELFNIGEVTRFTGVKAGTIRYYEGCGFLENVNRLPNNYRIFNRHHIYQVIICKLVFCGFVNKQLRKASMRIIEAAKEWDLSEYKYTTSIYLKLIQDEIHRVHTVIELVRSGLMTENASINIYTKKQAADILGITEETIRNWERNDLLTSFKPYQRRIYSQKIINRMYLIHLLINTGYSIMLIRKFLLDYDNSKNINSIELLVNPGEHKDLIGVADRYLQSLHELHNVAKELYMLQEEMKKL